MTATDYRVRRVEAGEALAGPLAGALAELLIDCVDGGASVGFLWPLERARAEAFWDGVLQGVVRGGRIVLVAQDTASGVLLGSVQLVLELPQNQPHRAEVAKMLVHRHARRQGVGAALLREAERAALQAQRTLLVLDTVTGSDAARLYERLGWQRGGEIPGYALWPRGGRCATTIFYKELV